MHFPTDRTVHTTTFDGPVVEHWLEWKIAQTGNAPTIQDRSTMQEDPNRYNWVLYRLSYVPPPLSTPSHTQYHIPYTWHDTGIITPRTHHDITTSHTHAHHYMLFTYIPHTQHDIAYTSSHHTQQHITYQQHLTQKTNIAWGSPIKSPWVRTPTRRYPFPPQLWSTASHLTRPLMSSSGTINVAVLRPVPFPKCASSNYKATWTPHAHTTTPSESNH